MQFSKLKSNLGSRVCLPDEEGYADAKTVWNAMVDRQPAAIVGCSSLTDIRQALEAARAQGVPLSVRGGGHNIAGTAVGDGALMIDLSALKTVEIEPDRQIVHVAGGATWQDLDAETQKIGMAVPGGVVSTTGIAGLTLGGGFGWLARLHGLSIDNLIAVELVLADGRCLTVSSDSNPDLFWAIRGGSGNFGIATRFTFKMHPVGPQVLFGPTFFALDDATTVLNAYGEHAHDLSREACVWANLMTAPAAPVLDEAHHGTKVLTLMQFHKDLDRGEAELKTLYGGIKPLGSALAPRPYREAQSFLDDVYAFGARNYWRAHNHTTLSPRLIDLLVEQAAHLPTAESEILICQLGGAIADIADGATAFPHRQVPFISTPGVRWHDRADDSHMIGWLKDLSAQISTHADPGAYVNFIAERTGRTEDAFGPNTERLRAVKQRYDPDNLFRINQNIVP